MSPYGSVDNRATFHCQSAPVVSQNALAEGHHREGGRPFSTMGSAPQILLIKSLIGTSIFEPVTGCLEGALSVDRGVKCSGCFCPESRHTAAAAAAARRSCCHPVRGLPQFAALLLTWLRKSPVGSRTLSPGHNKA